MKKETSEGKAGQELKNAAGKDLFESIYDILDTIHRRNSNIRLLRSAVDELAAVRGEKLIDTNITSKEPPKKTKEKATKSHFMEETSDPLGHSEVPFTKKYTVDFRQREISYGDITFEKNRNKFDFTFSFYLGSKLKGKSVDLLYLQLDLGYILGEYLEVVNLAVQGNRVPLEDPIIPKSDYVFPALDTGLMQGIDKVSSLARPAS